MGLSKMERRIRAAGALIALAATVPFYQNCGQAFEAQTAYLASSSPSTSLALSDLTITEPLMNTPVQGSLTLKGQCSPNVTIEITGDLASPVSAACIDRAFSAMITLSGADGTKSIVVTQRDSLGNTKADSRSFIKDSTAPQITILNLTTNAFVKNQVVVNGTCETNLTVVLKVGTVTTNASCTAGMYSGTLNIQSLIDGNISLEASQTDLAGSTTKQTLALKKDTTAPAVAFSAPAAASNVTSPLAFSGTCETGLAVTIAGSGVASSFSTECVNGTFSTNVNLVSGNGSRQISISQTDAAGNLGTQSRSFQLQTSGPAIAILISSPAASTAAKTGVTLTGSCQNGLSIAITGTGIQATTTGTCSNGAFSQAIVFSAGEGNKTITVTQTDSTSGTSGFDTRTFMKDTIAPALTIAAPLAAAATRASITVSGACETGLAVNISGTGVANASSTPCANGSYSTSVTTSTGDGAKPISVTQTDAATNSTTQTVSVVRDTTAPTLTITSPLAGASGATGVTIVGACETGLIVTASGTDLTSSMTGSCANSAYSIAVVFAGADGAKAVTLAQTDAAGNTGSVQRSFTKTTPPVVYSGADLYANNCSGCHGQLATSSKLGRSSAQITNAIANVATMNMNSNLRGLNGSQIQAIADALSPAPTGTKQLLCTASGNGNPTDLRRLTKVELSNTLKDLLGATIFADLQGSLSQLPEVGIGTAIGSFQNQYAAAEVEALANLAFAASESAIKTDANLNGLLSANSTCTNYASVTTACVQDFVTNFGLKVFRRPLTTAEVTNFKNVYANGVDTKDKFSYLIVSFLQMPQFLYHVELGTAGVDTNSEFTISPYEAASRMSYMIWGTMPSDLLFQQAANGDLNDATKLATTVATMMTDARASNKVTEFFKYWLNLTNVPNFPTNTTYLNGISTAGLHTEMVREMNQFVNHVVFTQKKGYQELLTSKVSFAKTAALASIYEHSLAANPDTGSQVMGPGRKGLFMRGSFLAYGDTENHPIIRASKLRQRVLCDTLGAPPDAAQTTNAQVDTLPYIQQYTTRERMTMKTAPSECMGCHGQMNSLGFALEGFDSLGRRSLIERNYDRTSGALLATHDINPVVSGLNIESGGPNSSNSAEDFVDQLISSDKAISCFSRQIFRYYKVQQEDMTKDGCLLANMRDTMNGTNGSIYNGIMTLVKDTNFRKKKVNP